MSGKGGGKEIQGKWAEFARKKWAQPRVHARRQGVVGTFGLIESTQASHFSQSHRRWERRKQDQMLKNTQTAPSACIKLLQRSDLDITVTYLSRPQAAPAGHAANASSSDLGLLATTSQRHRHIGPPQF